MQDARLKQLSTDLRSDLNTNSLTHLMEMVSDLVQQLRDSMAKQAHPQRQTQPSYASARPPGPLLLLEPPDLPSSSLPEEASARPLCQGVTPPDPTGRAPAPCRQYEDEEVSTSRRSHAQRVLSESEIELDLEQSHASSNIIEEEVATIHMAESVAESVSDLQYSMDFEGSVHRSPLSGFRSPMLGESGEFQPPPHPLPARVSPTPCPPPHDC